MPFDIQIQDVQKFVESAAPYFTLGYVALITGITVYGLAKHKKKQRQNSREDHPPQESPLEENVNKYRTEKPVLRDLADYNQNRRVGR